jgi:hypothetical protein
MKIRPKFTKDIERFREILATGIEDPQEISAIMQVKEKYLEDIQKFLKIDNDLSTDDVFRKYILKSRVRYAQLIEVKQRAEKEGNLFVQIKCIELMKNIDETVIKVGQELGIIFKHPEQIQLKLPPEIEEYQEQLKLLEIKYLRITRGETNGNRTSETGRLGDKEKEGGNERRFRERNLLDEGEDKIREEEAFKEIIPFLTF